MKMLLLALAVLSLNKLQADSVTPATTPTDTQQAEHAFLGTRATYAYAHSSGAVFAGVSDSNANAILSEYAVAGYAASGKSFVPFAKKQVFLDAMPHAENPITGQAIRFVIASGTFPIVVTQKEPHTLYCYHNITDLQNFKVSSYRPFDEKGAYFGNIIGMAPAATLYGQQPRHAFFIAIQNREGKFGEAGSGITSVQFDTEVVDIVWEEHNIPLDTNAKKGASSAYEAVLFRQGAFIPVQRDSAQLAIGEPLAAIDNDAQQPVIFHQDLFGALYTGFSVRGAAGSQAGARAMLVGSRALAPATAFDKDSIVGGVGPNIQVAIHDIKTIFTSTSLPYLLVRGGVGAPETTKNAVYALPMTGVIPADTGYVGMLAKKGTHPTTMFEEVSPQRFKGRIFAEPALQKGDLYSSTDKEVCVGNQVVLPGDITALWSVGDAVYATCTSSDQQLGGLFYSQALFDRYGAIKGWTNWQRAAQPMNALGGVINEKQASFVLWNAYEVQRTHWNSATTASASKQTVDHSSSVVTPDVPQHDFGTLVQHFFPEEQYGVQGITDIPSTHPINAQTPGYRHSFVMLTGHKRVAFIQTGCDQGRVITPVTTYDTVHASTNGTMSGLQDIVSGITCTGGALDTLGAITTSAVAYDATQAWFVVAGNGGIAVLAHEDGTGCSLPLVKHFGSFDIELRFVKIGATRDIKKIIALGHTLYILTKKQLLRIELSQQTIKNGVEQVTTLLAQAEDFKGSHWLEDVVVSGNLVLLGTSKGLWRVGDGCSGQTATSTHEMGWTPVQLNESPGPVTQLFAITPTGCETDLATCDAGGQVYVLSAYMGYHQARVYRLTIMPGLTVGPETVVPFPDHFIRAIPSFYINIGDYRNRLFTEGAHLFFSRSRYNPTNTDASLQVVVPYEIHSEAEKREDGTVLPWTTARTRSLMREAVSIAQLRSKKSLGMVKRLSGNGYLVIAGDAGLELHN